MVKVYFDHVNFTTEFSRSNRRCWIPCSHRILSLMAIFSDDHSFRPTTTPAGALEVPLSVKASHAPLQHSTLHHGPLFFSALEFTRHTWVAHGGRWITVLTCASYPKLTTCRKASLNYSHPLSLPKSGPFVSFSLRKP